MAERFASIDEYVASFPTDVQTALEGVRQAIRRGAPEAVEAIAYQMPTFKRDGTSILHFSGWKKHVGMYPIPSGDDQLTSELDRYRSGQGTLKFPLNEPMPYGLIERIAAQAWTTANDPD